jgi:hypothetical protein
LEQLLVRLLRKFGFIKRADEWRVLSTTMPAAAGRRPPFRGRSSILREPRPVFPMEALAGLDNPAQKWALFQAIETGKGNLITFNIGRIAALSILRLHLSYPATGKIRIWSLSKP